MPHRQIYAMTFPQEFRDTRACPPIADQSDIRWRFPDSGKQGILLSPI
jgi:hypothetical protein